MTNKKDDSLLGKVAKDLIKEKVSGYISKDVKPAVEELVELTQVLSPNGYKDVIKNFTTKAGSEMVDHPSHYGGESNPYEAIKVIEAWDLDFLLGNSIKYISRAGKKDPGKEIEDLEKAVWYIQRKIENIKKGD